MKILCFADNHFSEKSSILTKYGDRYTIRLQNQLQSLNWLEEQAIAHNCDVVIGLGDFFDHAILTDQELTALQEVAWADIPHYFIVGNHESEENDLQYSSAAALSARNRFVVNEPTLLKYPDKGGTSCVELAFLPYVVESNKKPIEEYFPVRTDTLRLLFSHNDILGLQLGPVVSRTGFSREELQNISHLCVNGHLHNGTQISPTILNLGNLTGKDFSEDAAKYSHKIILIDTDTFQVEFLENPFAFNFYKLEITCEDHLEQFKYLKSNAVVSIKCKESLMSAVRNQLMSLPNIVESRVILLKSVETSELDATELATLCVDQCEKFAECCRARLDNSEILEAELAEILK